MLPGDAFRFGTPLALVYATMGLLAMAVTSDDVFVPLFLQVLHGRSPLVAGYLSALMAGGWTVGSVTSSNLSGRNARRIIVAAPCVSLAGTVLLLLLMPTHSDGGWIRLGGLAIGLFSLGFGVGLGWPHLLTWILTLAAPDEQDRASASITTVQLYATAMGAAVAGLLANTAGLADPGGIEGTARAAVVLFAVFTAAPVACLVFALRFVRSI